MQVPSRIAASSSVPGAVSYMLRDDVSKGVVPYGRQGHVYTLDGALGLGRRYADALRLNDRIGSIDEFVRTVGFSLFDQYELWIEVFVQAKHETEAPFAIAPVSNVLLERSGGVFQQLPPLESLPEWVQLDDRWGQRIELERDRLVRVSLPRGYPEKRLARVKQDLAAMPLLTRPEWAIEHLVEPRAGDPVFDFNEAARTDRLAVLQAALPIGWHAREVLMDRNVNEYYRYLRELRFLHFLTSLREEAEGALREVLTIGRSLSGVTVEVTAHHLCTPVDIGRYIHQFEAGELTFSKVTDIIYQKPGLAKVERRRVV